SSVDTLFIIPSSQLSVSYLFIFLLLLRPRRSTLFPYTTLFRSEAAGAAGLARDGDGGLLQLGRDSLGLLQLPLGLRGGLGLLGSDRKSTRLNSSHVKISYVVFCLNKNNNSDSPTESESNQRTRD